MTSRRQLRMEELLEDIRSGGDVRDAAEEWLFCNRLNDDQFEQIYPGNLKYEVEWLRNGEEDSFTHRSCHGLDYRTLVVRLINELRNHGKIILHKINPCEHPLSRDINE